MHFRDLKAPKGKAKVEDMKQYLPKWMCPVLLKKTQKTNTQLQRLLTELHLPSLRWCGSNLRGDALSLKSIIISVRA